MTSVQCFLLSLCLRTSPTFQPDHRKRSTRKVQLSAGTFEVGVLAHVASHISSSPSIRLKGQKCWGTSQDGVNMASKWRIDGVFWTCALKKWGQLFTRVGLLVDLYSVTWWTMSLKLDTFFPKSIHQQQLLRDSLNDVIQTTNMASKFNKFSNFN